MDQGLLAAVLFTPFLLFILAWKMMEVLDRLSKRLKKLEKASIARDKVETISKEGTMSKENMEGEGEADSKEDEEDDSSSSDDEEKAAAKPLKKSKAKSKKEKKGKGKSKEEKKKAKKNKVSKEDWEWPVYDEFFSMLTYRHERKLREVVKEGPNTAPFEVTYRQKQDWPDQVLVTLLSEHLIAVAKHCLPLNKYLLLEQPRVEGQHLFLALDLLRAYRPQEELGKCHLRHLVRFLETEYKDTIVHLERMLRERTVSWELLWAFLVDGEKVCYTCSMTGQKLQGVVALTYYDNDMAGKKLEVCIEVRDYNGQAYVKGRVFLLLKQFQGEKMLEEVGVCPMRYVEQREQLEAMFLANGRKFFHLAEATWRSGGCYMQYKGPWMTKVQNPNGCWQLKKKKADGRVMVDLLSFARMNPEFPLDNAETPSNCEVCVLQDKPQEVPCNEELMLAPAVVFGFSFAIKKWGAFDVTGLSEIIFDDEAFDRDLVLTDSTQKQMLLSLVKQYVKGPSEGAAADKVLQIDPISNKGEGCIFLCYGPPGTGKTLTAESVAEKMHRPLWSVSVFELGTNPNAVETSLLEILDIASQWRAILLLDEADIYLEKRTSNGDPNRSAMTAIFLRLLEYYRGVLFLTTNRVTSFDDAFCSRISMFLRYYRLSGEQREKVWGNFLARAGVMDADLAPLVDNQLNGREIRNTIRIAQTWAKSSGVEVTIAHVLQVVQMLDGFRETLQDAINYDGEEKQIFSSLAKKACCYQQHF